MRVLILSISTGEGHHATGHAIQNYLHGMGVECTTLDAYEYIEPLLKNLVSRGYLISTSYLPKLSSKFYNLAVRKKKPVRKNSVSKLTNTFMAEELKTYIDSYRPDAVVCTHVLSSTMVSILKERRDISCLTAGVVTDFTLHPFWEECRALDYIVTPTELLEYQMRKKGLASHQMLPFGIPIKPKFSQRKSQQEARMLLDLDQNVPVILVMSGSMGYGKIDESLLKLDKLSYPFQVMVICGNNKKMQKKITKMLPRMKKLVKVYGFVDNVDLMMDAADCIVTKPGGITSSEALAKGLPMIMVNPIPGHEQRNAEFMLNNGIALYATKSFPLDEAVFSLFRHPKRLDDLRQTIGLYGKRNSTKDVCEFLVNKVRQRTEEAGFPIEPDPSPWTQSDDPPEAGRGNWPGKSDQTKVDLQSDDLLSHQPGSGSDLIGK